MTARSPRSVRDWPLAVKVIVALAITLLPPGILAVLAAVRSYRTAVEHGASVIPSLAQALTIALPVLMWLAALAIGWFVANRFIVRPLTRMRLAVDRYTAGDKTARLDARQYFSREVAALADAFDRMADDIATHDAEIDAALGEQKRLTREVHHRVKNNLQIVSSLLSIQARDAANAEVAHAYAAIQSRVAALAIVHRWMYENDAPGGQAGVDLKALATDLAAGLEQNLSASERIGVTVVPDVERLFVSQDTAVPLAFLITELVTCAARETAPDSLEALITAERQADRATLRVAAAIFTGVDQFVGGTHPSSRIVAGMARQLRSPLVHDAAAGSYTITFALPAGTPATD